MEYVHYGHKEFDESLFQPIQNDLFVKPNGGLWASPIGAKNGWKEWCEAENFKDCESSNSFRFSLSDNANVLHLRCTEDLKRLPLNPKAIGYALISKYWLDFEQILNSGIDAIEVHISEDNGDDWHDSLYYNLYGWDCDSILIMNKDIVEVIK